MFKLNCSIFVLACLAISVNCTGFRHSCFEATTSKKADDCCLLPKFYSSQMVSDCLISLTNATSDAEKYMCLVECIAKKLNVFKDNQMDREATLKLYTSRMGTVADFVPIMGDIFEQCYSGLSGYVAQDQANPSKCSVVPMMILNCLQTRLFQNCPAKLWQGGAECQELKEKLLEGCPFVAIASL